ncbi:hypothetical protein FVF58_28205 [Paraburkholderia panacisoli]|uniref:Uncharacterized protein n=1 Tax=Paraburkholderia panacisoli TaxID=2603818 RepID=A0A5B0GSN6_9BURK|nr:hypothetical protein [Paraburkholderia panacisoli]KAA1005880.1 hypothetical protein FVF58_28205 [Paraburkholderia panacisoli]
MRIVGWLVTGLAVVLAGGAVATWLAPGFDEAQANTDRQTVECLTNRLTADDQAQIAQFADKNDFESLWRVYDRVFPDCAVRGDQRERKAQLEASAWSILQSDRKFMRLREANAALASGAH